MGVVTTLTGTVFIKSAWGKSTGDATAVTLSIVPLDGRGPWASTDLKSHTTLILPTAPPPVATLAQTATPFAASTPASLPTMDSLGQKFDYWITSGADFAGNDLGTFVVPTGKYPTWLSIAAAWPKAVALVTKSSQPGWCKVKGALGVASLDPGAVTLSFGPPPDQPTAFKSSSTNIFAPDIRFAPPQVSGAPIRCSWPSSTRVLDCAGGACKEGGKVQLWTDNAAAGQKWTFDAKTHKLSSGGMSLGTTRWASADGTPVLTSSASNNVGSWYWQPDRFGGWQLMDIMTRKCLDVTDGDDSDGTALQLKDCAKSDTQWMP